MVQRNATGPPEIVYCGRQLKADTLFHEIMITELRLLFPNDEFHRNVRVGRTTADGLLIRNGNRAYVELDSGEMSVKTQMQAKWQRYAGVQDFLLVVCLTEDRMHRLMRHAEPVKNIALFTTIERLKSAMAQPWLDTFGNSLAI